MLPTSNNGRAKRVLVIAYYFPPSGGGGVQRIAKFVRYLPEFGWLPTVLTVDPSYHDGNRDHSHTAEFPAGIEIIRIPKIGPAFRFKRSHSALNEVEQQRNPVIASARSSRLRSFARRCRVYWGKFRRAFFWRAHAVAAGLKAHRDHRFDLILATGEPYSDYLIAVSLSRLTRTPFVIDMRDPWTLDPYQTEPLSAARSLVQRWQERRVLSACRACIFANRSIDRYANAFPRLKQKFHYISNGFDSADFENVEPMRFDRFTVVHNGNFLAGYRTADTFLFALRDLLQAEPALRERMQVFFVGSIREEGRLIKQLSLGDVVKETGYLPHRQSLEYVKGANLLLLVGGKHRWEETGKLYEYLAAGRPILALVHPEGAAADVLRQYPAASVVDRDQRMATYAALRAAMTNGLEAVSRPGANHETGIEKYERKRLTRTLAQILDESLR